MSSVYTTTYRNSAIYYKASVRDAFQKKIAYNETLSYLGVGGVKEIPTIFHLRNGTFFYGRGGQNYMFYVSFLEKSSLRRENFQISSPSIANFPCFTLWFNIRPSKNSNLKVFIGPELKPPQLFAYL